MKFRIGIAEAKAAFESSAVVLSSDSKIQDVLKNSLVQADPEGVLIQGTDLEIAMISRQQAYITEPGAVLIDTKRLSDIIRYASGEFLEFETTENSVVIRSATGKASLLSRDINDFPKVEDFDESKPFSTIARVQFIQAIQKVLFSVCEDETRRAINGLKINNNTFISSDGKMISVYKSIIPFDLQNVLLPQRAIAALLRILKASDEEVFKFQDSTAFYYFKLGNTVFSIRKVTIQFPEDLLINKVSQAKAANTASFRFDRIALISAIERVRLNASSDSNAIFLGIGESETNLKSKDNFGNFSVEKLPSEKLSEATSVSVFFNWVNLLDALKAMVSEKITLSFSVKNAERSPLFIGEDSLDVVLLPIEMAFDASSLN